MEGIQALAIRSEQEGLMPMRVSLDWTRMRPRTKRGSGNTGYKDWLRTRTAENSWSHPEALARCAFIGDPRPAL